MKKQYVVFNKIQNKTVLSWFVVHGSIQIYLKFVINIQVTFVSFLLHILVSTIDRLFQSNTTHITLKTLHKQYSKSFLIDDDVFFILLCVSYYLIKHIKNNVK